MALTGRAGVGRTGAGSAGAGRAGAGRERFGPGVVRAARAEWGVLAKAVRDHVRRHRWASAPLAVGAALLVLVFSVVQHLPGGETVVGRLGVVRAALPLGESLLRTPLSLYVPAPDLPVWGALVQVLLAFGAAEIVLGRRLTLAVAYAGTLAGTVFARVAVELGPEHLLGLPGVVAHVRDTGPSAAVVALAVCTAVRCRAWWTGGAVAAAMVVEAVLLPNLAGLEHVVAVAAALLIAGALEALDRLRAAPPVRVAVPARTALR